MEQREESHARMNYPESRQRKTDRSNGSEASYETPLCGYETLRYENLKTS